MNEILNRLVELVKFVEKLGQELNSRQATLEAREARISVVDGELKAKDKELKDREFKIETVENVMAIKQENSAKEKELEKARNKFEQDKKDFDKFRMEQSNLIQLDNHANKVEATRLANLEKTLEADVKQRVMTVLKNAKVNLVAPELDKL